MNDAPIYRLHDSLGYRLSIASRLQERRLDEGLKTLGLTRTTWCVLLAVGNEGLGQPTDIARFVGIDRTATSRALRAMEKQGLLERSCGTPDKRTRQVSLTRKGRETIASGSVFARQNAEVMAQVLDGDEIVELKRLLGKLRSAGKEGLNTL